MPSTARRIPLGLVALAAAVLAPLAGRAQPTFVEQGASVLGGVNYVSRSASLADIDRDGDLDVFFAGSSQSLFPTMPRLLRNNRIGTGFLTFTDISTSLPSGIGSSWSAAWGDYNGDRNIDVFIGQENLSASSTGDVIRNNGALSFTNASVATGLNDPGFHQNVAWSDIDNDRDLDLVIGMEGPEKNEIYLQGPGGTFTPVGAAVGLQTDFGYKAYGMAIGDTDGDGDMDIYLSTCRMGGDIRNNFYKNQLVETGHLAFTDIADSNGTQYRANSYGAEFHDFDDDGDLDLFMVGADQQPSKIFRNNGGNMFTDVDAIIGHALLSNSGGDYNGARPIDYDNDGDLDLFFHDHLSPPGSGKNFARKLFRNDGNWQFTDVTTAEGVAAVNEGAYDSTWGDLDLDGDLDLIAPTDSRFAERVFLSNASTNGNHWLYIRLAGGPENSTAIGASLYATLNEGSPQERTLRREANTNAGTFNQSDLPIHFGLGAATMIDDLCIQWPDGLVQHLYDVAVDRYLTISRPGDFDADGDVDGADLTRWRINFAASSGSDSDGDGDTDGADFLAWQRRTGSGVRAIATTTATPEPASAALALITLAAISRLSRGLSRS